MTGTYRASEYRDEIDPNPDASARYVTHGPWFDGVQMHAMSTHPAGRPCPRCKGER